MTLIPNDDNSLQKTLREHRALAVLRLLAGQDLNGAVNEAVLSFALDERALGGSRDLLRDCLSSLESSSLVTTAKVGELLVARLTPRGLDVAQGRERSEGVEPFGVGCLY